MIPKNKKINKKKVGNTIDFLTCPICGNNKKDKFIGIEDPYIYDGITYWRCMNCATEWERFTGKIIIHGTVDKKRKKNDKTR